MNYVMKKQVLVGMVCLLMSYLVSSQTKFQKDFDFMLSTLKNQYAYFDSKLTNLEKIKELYQPRVDNITKDSEFIRLVEDVMYEFYDMHMSINKNLSSSFRLIPSHTDAWIELIDGKYVVVDVRPTYEAENKGLKVGATLLSVNGTPINQLVNNRLPKSIKNSDEKVKVFLANQIFAGRHDEKREITIAYNGTQKVLSLDKPTIGKSYKSLLESKKLEGNVGYIKINNSLGNNDLINDFNKAVKSMRSTKALILDIRETPDGGNTTVARAIMGKFIIEDMLYQKHEYPAEERYFGVKRSWVEFVSPYGEVYNKPVIVLVGHWTGSVGEALALGFDRIPKAKVVGTKMAGLLGAITCYRFKETGVNLCFPFEKLYHINGTPREDFIPRNRTMNSRETYKKALQLLKDE